VSTFSVSDLAARAKKLGLPRCAELVTDALPAPAPADAGLAAPLATESQDIINQLRRRGLDPELIRRLLPHFDERPLEAGLIAWDVLCSTLLPPEEDALRAELLERARKVKSVLPGAGSPYAWFRRQKSQELVEALAAPPFESVATENLPDTLTRRALGPIDVVRRRIGGDELIKSGFVEATREFAYQLHLCHLSTLASFYLNYLWTAFDYAPALESYVEVLLDAGAGDALPSSTLLFDEDADPSRIDFFGYVHARRGMLKNEYQTLWDEMKMLKIDYFNTPPEKFAAVRLPLVHLAVGLEMREPPVPFAVIDAIAKAHPSWRYAHLVRLGFASAIAEIDSDKPVAAVDQFVEGFGNDFQLWFGCAHFAPTTAQWTTPVRSRLVRELITLPHDWTVWTGLASFAREFDVLDEVTARLAEQAKL
jgi:hypothetical protein